MAESTTVEQFNKMSSATLDWRGRKDDLVTRRAWGDRNFEDLKPHTTRSAPTSLGDNNPERAHVLFN